MSTELNRAQIRALVAEMDALYAERERISARLAQVTELILSSARWRGGEYGEWIPIAEYGEVEGAQS